MLAVTKIYDLVEKLSNERKTVIYKLALDMLSAQQSEEFDSFTQDEIDAIQNARKKIAEGDCLSFSSADELLAHFEV